MSSNYPPGVTGSEYEIAGPDYEKESDTPCPQCGADTIEQGYRGERWLYCPTCTGETSLPPPDEPDPDRAYDEERDRRILSDE